MCHVATTPNRCGAAGPRHSTKTTCFHPLPVLPGTKTTMADESKTSDVATLLAKFTVDDFPFTRKVVYVDGNTLLEDAFKIMGQNGVSSLPVHSDGAWVGFIDINDLVTHGR